MALAQKENLNFAAVAPAAAMALQQKMAARKDAMERELGAMDSAAGAALMQVLRQARPTWKERDLLVVQWKLAKAGVCSVTELVEALQGKKELSLNQRLTDMGQRSFTAETLKALRDVAAPAAPESPKRRPSAAGRPLGTISSALAAANAMVAEARVEDAEVAKAVCPAAYAALGPKNHLQDVSRVFSPPKRRSSRITPQYFSMMDVEEEAGSDEEVNSRRLSSVYRVYEDDTPEHGEQQDKGQENTESQSRRVSAAHSENPGRLSQRAEEFAEWLEERKPLHRFDQMSSGLAWEWPLARGEKKELLLLQVAAGEEQAAEDAFILRVKQTWERKKKRSSTLGVGGKVRGAAARRRSRIHR